jgi:hypothetical protein
VAKVVLVVQMGVVQLEGITAGPVAEKIAAQSAQFALSGPATQDNSHQRA